MSTKFTIWHNESTHVFGEVFEEDTVGIEIINPEGVNISTNVQSGSTLSLTLKKEHLAEIAKAYIEWYKNACKSE